MNKAEDRLKRMFQFNQEIDVMEQTLKSKKKQWRELSEDIRSLAQTISNNIKTLRGML